MKLAIAYALACALVNGSLLLAAGTGLAGPGVLSAVEALFLLFSFYALARFQRDGLPLTVPLLPPVMAGLAFQVALVVVVSQAEAQSGAAVLLDCFAIVSLLTMTVAGALLFFRLRRGKVVASLPVEGQAAVVYGGFWRRLCASVVDALVLGAAGAVIFSIVSLALAAATMSGGQASAQDTLSVVRDAVVTTAVSGFSFGVLAPVAGGTNIIAGIAYLSRMPGIAEAGGIGGLVSGITIEALSLGSVLYFALMESSSRQATFGKQALGLRVTDCSGGRVSFWLALRRNFLKLVPFGTFGLGFLYVFFSPTRQGVHDLLAKSLVVQTGEGPAQGRPA